MSLYKKVKLIVPGTTTTTNALLERKLSKTGFITTKGFRDVIELGRRTRPNSYGMLGKFVPIIPRDLRYEVNERINASGKVIKSLSEIEIINATKKLLKLGCESIVIHFLHSYANNQHELMALEIISKIWPNNYITMGHSLLSENREYERGVTAAINASVQPILEKYLNKLEKELLEIERIESLIKLQNIRNAQLTDSEQRYILTIKAKIENNWLIPHNTKHDKICTAIVNQLPSGKVTSVTIHGCKGDSIYIDSLVNAVWKSSPLPVAPDIEVFQENIVLQFEEPN